MSSTRTTKAAEKDETEFKRCECGCSLIVNPKRHFAPGHDQRHKGVLLRKFDEGDTAAAAELIERGWRSEAELAERKATAEKREQAKQEREANCKAKAAPTKTATEEVVESVAEPVAKQRKAREDQPVQPVA